LGPLSNTGTTVVPVLTVGVYRTRHDGGYGRDIEMTHEELQGYYVTPEDSRAGNHGRRLSFREAISLFIV
jgi:hypothetical protein